VKIAIRPLSLSLLEAEEEVAEQTPHTNTNVFSLWKRNRPKCCGKFLLCFFLLFSARIYF